MQSSLHYINHETRFLTLQRLPVIKAFFLLVKLFYKYVYKYKSHVATSVSLFSFA